MSQKSQPEPRIGTDVPTQERNWLPLAIAAAVVLAILAGFLLFGTHRKTTTITQINAPLDPYAASLPLSDIVMSESANLAGGKVTYVDGSIANLGNRTVSAVTVQVLFHDFNQKVALKFEIANTHYTDRTVGEFNEFLSQLAIRF